MEYALYFGSKYLLWNEFTKWTIPNIETLNEKILSHIKADALNIYAATCACILMSVCMCLKS